VTSGLNEDDVSIGRFPDGADHWILFGAGCDDPCTPGATNQQVAVDDDVIPETAVFISAYPNPSRGTAQIQLSGSKSNAKLLIYNLKGHLVREYNNITDTKTMWDGCDMHGKPVCSGTYIITANFG